MYHIYLITNIVNNKVYVGQTATSVRLRWQCHLYCARSGNKRYLYNAIRSDGERNFCISVLNTLDTKAEADQFERLWILALGSFKRTVGYNCTLGGDGCIHTVETRDKISK